MNIIENLIVKLSLKENITKTYQEMYLLAEKIAIHELQVEEVILYASSEPKDGPDKIFKNQKHMAEFKQKRIQHHINEMKNLLILKEDLKRNEKNL